MAMIDYDKPSNDFGFSIKKQCLLFCLNRSNIYYQKIDKELSDQDFNQ
jgi:hypothetical protein